MKNTGYAGKDNKRRLGLYIHIPFCVKKCHYCDFLSAPADDVVKSEYINALIKEIDSYQNRTAHYYVPTVFIGGGTPSCIDAKEIERVLRELERTFLFDSKDVEVTIEINPGTVDRQKLLIYRRAGINRLSFGLQSADNVELKRLGRIHTYEEFVSNYRMARELGFSNINIDLMSALPGQTSASWEDTLNKVIALKPEHISAYSLIIEEGTVFYEQYRPGAPGERELPDEDMDRRIYYRTKELLAQSGYFRYEISNYARQGFECRHNNSYWTGIEYLGLGLGAASLIENTRFSNRSELIDYIEQCRLFTEKRNCAGIPVSRDIIGLRREQIRLTKKQRMEEFMFLGLRREEGISKEAFYRRFCVELTSIYDKVLSDLVEKKVLRIAGDNIRLTEYGIDVSNIVLSNFLLD